MSSSLWLSIEPKPAFIQLHLTQPGIGTLLKGRLGPTPMMGGLSMLLEALSSWHQLPLSAVLDADAEEVARNPERWSRLLGEAGESPRITVVWSVPPPGRLSRGRFFEGMGDFRSSRRLLTQAAVGLR